jgi:ribosome-associated protein
MTHLNELLLLIEKELDYQFIRASGPGGQNVNKVSSSVQLRFDVRNSPTLPEDLKRRLIKFAGYRVTQNEVLIITARRYRSQDKNREDALKRLTVLLQKAVVSPKRRQPTRATSSSQVKRLESKIRRGKTKQLRRNLNEE